MFLIEENEATRKKTIVPKEEFIRSISASTGFTEQELKIKDIGEIERKLNITAKKPNNLWSVKRGKSMTELYIFCDQNKKQKALKMVDTILTT
jgi:hypothetical protein